MNTGAIEICEDFWKMENCSENIQRILWIDSIFEEGYILTVSDSFDNKSWYVGNSDLFDTVTDSKYPIYTLSKQNENWKLYKTDREFAL